MVYRARTSDRDWASLIKALTPGQLPLLEDATSLQGDESLSRCSLNRLDLNSFRVRSLPVWVSIFCAPVLFLT